MRGGRFKSTASEFFYGVETRSASVCCFSIHLTCLHSNGIDVVTAPGVEARHKVTGFIPKVLEMAGPPSEEWTSDAMTLLSREIESGILGERSRAMLLTELGLARVLPIWTKQATLSNDIFADEFMELFRPLPHTHACRVICNIVGSSQWAAATPEVISRLRDGIDRVVASYQEAVHQRVPGVSEIVFFGRLQDTIEGILSNIRVCHRFIVNVNVIAHEPLTAHGGWRRGLHRRIGQEEGHLGERSHGSAGAVHERVRGRGVRPTNPSISQSCGIALSAQQQPQRHGWGFSGGTHWVP